MIKFQLYVMSQSLTLVLVGYLDVSSTWAFFCFRNDRNVLPMNSFGPCSYSFIRCIGQKLNSPSCDKACLWFCFSSFGTSGTSELVMKNRSEPELLLALRFKDDKQIRFGLGHSGCKELDSLQVPSVQNI